MASYSRALFPLCGCFRGKVPRRADWIRLIGLANHTLTTPSLIEFVNTHRAAIPEAVVAYVQEVHHRNVVRNDRLRAQLAEAVVALNRIGITPLLIKGTAILASSSPTKGAHRLMSDLDLVVRPKQIDAAADGLKAIGYSVDYQTDGRHKRWSADLKRPHDVGMIDLQQEFPGHVYCQHAPDDLVPHLRPIRLGAGNALVPSPELQVLVLVIHDQFQDYDYWTGSIDLRHLLDLRMLIAAPAGVQWDTLMSMASGTLVRNAVETQLLLLTTLFGVEWPAQHPKRLVPRMQVWRQLLQVQIPPIRYLLLPMGLLDYRSHHRPPAQATPTGTPPQRRKRWFPRFGTLLFLTSLSRRYRPGKL